MSEQSFSSIVLQYLSFLIADFDFSVKENLYGSAAFDGGEIDFRSPSTILVIELDRGEVRSSIGPTNEGEIGWLSLSRVVEYFSHGEDRSLLGMNGNPPYELPDWVELELSLISTALLKYCGSFLRGDFSRWFEIQKWSLQKMEDDYRVTTGLEFPQNQRYVLYIKEKERNNL